MENLKKCRYCKEVFLVWGGECYYLTCQHIKATDIRELEGTYIKDCKDFDLMDEIKEILGGKK